MKSDDEREVRPRRAQPVHQRAGSRPRVCRRFIAASTRSEPGLHRQMQERHQLRHVAVRGDQVVLHVARVRRWCSGSAAGPGSSASARTSRPKLQVPPSGAAPCQAFTFWPEQRDLARAGRDQPPRLGQHAGGGPAGLGAARVGHDAEASRTCRSLPARSGTRSRPAARPRRAGGRTCPRPGSPSRSPRRRPAPRAPPSPAGGDRSAAPARCPRRAPAPGSPRPPPAPRSRRPPAPSRCPAAARACLITRSRPSSENTFSSARSRMWQVLRMTMSASSGDRRRRVAERRQHVGHPAAVVHVHLAAPGDHVQPLRRAVRRLKARSDPARPGPVRAVDAAQMVCMVKRRQARAYGSQSAVIPLPAFVSAR